MHRSGFYLMAALCVFSAPVAVPSKGAAGKAAHAVRRIRFIGGALSAQTPGVLRGRGAEAFFVVKAAAGQHMLVNLISRTAGFGTAGTVKSPSGKQDGGPGGVIFNARLSETGDYTIRVAPDQMASTQYQGRFILEVVIVPGDRY